MGFDLHLFIKKDIFLLLANDILLSLLKNLKKIKKINVSLINYIICTKKCIYKNIYLSLN